MKNINTKVAELEFDRYIEILESLVDKKLGADIKVESITVKRNNGHMKKGLRVNVSGSNINPNIYLGEMYDRQRKDGATMKQAVDEFVECYQLAKRENVPEDFLQNWEDIKDKIIIKVINAEWNKELLENVPHIKVLDLAIVYLLALKITHEDTATMLIKKEHLELWGITEKILKETAESNIESVLPVEFISMEDILSELLGISETVPNLLDEEEIRKDYIYVLTNKFRWLGASVLFYDGILDKIGQLFNTDFLILPSSIHECIIVKDKGGCTKEEASAMVKEINREVVEKENRLSDRVYHYSIATKQLSV